MERLCLLVGGIYYTRRNGATDVTADQQQVSDSLYSTDQIHPEEHQHLQSPHVVENKSHLNYCV
jgi:hypothetical protein